jgi:hypothetical protein
MSALQYLMACCIWFDCADTPAGSDMITIADAAATTNLRKAIGPSLEARNSNREEIGLVLASDTVNDDRRQVTHLATSMSGWAPVSERRLRD